MSGEAIQMAWGVEELGLIGFMFLCIGLLLGVIFTVYKDRKACDQARLLDANERSEMNKQLGEFKGKLDIMEKLHIETMLSSRGDQR